MSSADSPNPPPATPPVSPGDVAAPQYEFTEQQNQVIGDLAMKMRVVGLVLIVLGVLTLLGGLGNLTSHRFHGGIVGGVIYILIGAWTRGAAYSFRKIVTSQGQDISHLMSALTDLRKAYTLLYIFILVVVVLVIVTLLVVVGIALWERFRDAGAG